MRTWLGLAERVAGGDEHARAREARRELGAGSVGCAAHTKFAWLSVTSKPTLAQRRGQRGRSSRIVCTRRVDQLRAAAQRLERAGLRDLGDAEVGLELGQQLPRAGPADRVADAQAGEAPGLGEAAEHEQARVALEQLQRGARRAARRRTRRATRRAARRRRRAGPRAGAAARSSASSSPVGSLGLASAIARTSGSRAAASSSASTPPLDAAPPGRARGAP